MTQVPRGATPPHPAAAPPRPGDPGERPLVPARDSRPRPPSVTAALVLAAVAGTLNVVVGGTLLVLLRTGRLAGSSALLPSTLRAVAWTYAILGTVTVLAAAALWLRRPGSRMLLTVVMILRIGTASISVGLVGTLYSVGSVTGIVVSVLVVALLWDSRANGWFPSAR